MSSAVRTRLAEMAEQSQARRRRMREITMESSRIFERVHRLRESGVDIWEWAQGADTAVTAPDLQRELGDTLSQTQPPPDGDVLDQVQSLLRSADARQKEKWDDDDTRIFLCLNEIWIAAERKGYTLEDLQSVLRLLGPPQ